MAVQAKWLLAALGMYVVGSVLNHLAQAGRRATFPREWREHPVLGEHLSTPAPGLLAKLTGDHFDWALWAGVFVLNLAVLSLFGPSLDFQLVSIVVVSTLVIAGTLVGYGFSLTMVVWGLDLPLPHKPGFWALSTAIWLPQWVALAGFLGIASILAGLLAEEVR